MPPTTNSLMQITDGTTTITIMDSAGGLAYNAAGYRLKYGGYAPKVADKRIVILGGQDHYNEIEENLTIEIKGSSADDCFIKLEALATLLDQSTRFFYDERVNPVLFKYQPKGSNLTAPCQRLILRNLTDNNTIQLPSAYDDAGNTTWLAEITIRFICRGLWHTILGTDSFASGSQNSGTVFTATSGITATVPNPTEVVLGTLAASPYTGLSQGYLLIAPGSDQISKLDASGFTGSDFSSVADTAKLADGNLCRFTPTVINENTTSARVNLTNQFVSKKLAFYATVRNNSASKQFQIAIVASEGPTALTSPTTVETPMTVIDNSTVNPRVVYLGSVSCPVADSTRSRGFSRIALHVKGPSDITGTPTLDIDTVVAIGMDSDYSYAIWLPFAPTVTGVASPNIRIRNTPNSILRPQVYVIGSTTEVGIQYDGNPAIYTIGTVVSGCWLTTFDTFWRAINAASALISVTATLTRDAGYLVPR